MSKQVSVLASVLCLLAGYVSGFCPPPVSPVNGNVAADLATATYSCLPNFNLVGARVVSCTNMNTWSQDAPICTGLLCGSLIAPINGSVSENAQRPETTPVGTVVTFACQEGFVLVGSPQITCVQVSLALAIWNGYYPVCQERAPTVAGYAMNRGSCLGHEDIAASTVFDPYDCAGKCTRDANCRGFNIYTSGAGALTCQPMSYGCAPNELQAPLDRTRYFYQKVTAVPSTAVQRSFVDVRNCMNDKQAECQALCQESLPNTATTPRSMILNCFTFQRDERRVRHTTCLANAGVSMTDNCYMPAVKTGAEKLKCDGQECPPEEFPVIAQFKICMKECKRGTKEKCTTGCTSRPDDKIKANLKACYGSGNVFAEGHKKLKTCLLAAGVSQS